MPAAGRTTRLRLCGQDDPGVDVTTGAETARLVAHAGTVSALCQLSDGWLASSSWDNTIRLWDVASGAEGARIEVDALVRAIAALAPKLIVAGDQRGLRWLEVVD
jgi:WD40 repeat protein